MRHALSILALCFQLHAATYYVATNGNDGGTGAIDDPWLTLTNGAAQVAHGDTLFIRGGTYSGQRMVLRRENLLVSGYQDEIVVVDGERSIPTAAWGELVSVGGTNTTVSNLCVTGSKWYGLNVGHISNRVTHVNSYSNTHSGIVVTSGGYHTIDHCNVWENSQTNYNHTNGVAGGWSGGLNVTQCTNVTVSSNIVFGNWGEGLSVFRATNCTVQGNVSYDSQTIFYLQNAASNYVIGNLFYSSYGNQYFWPSYSNLHTCIMIGDEITTEPNRYNLIANNLCVGGQLSLWWYGVASAPYPSNCTIIGNTFANARGSANVNIGVTNVNNVWADNITYQADTNTTTVGVLATPAVGTIALSNNLWYPSTPANFSGTDDVEADPLLRQAGSTAAGSLTYKWFQLSIASPARGAGIANADLTTDYLGTTRSDPPDIGGLQFIPYRLLNAGTIRAGTLRGP